MCWSGLKGTSLMRSLEISRIGNGKMEVGIAVDVDLAVYVAVDFSGRGIQSYRRKFKSRVERREIFMFRIAEFDL